MQSQKWADLVKDVPIVAMARAEPINLGDCSEFELREVVAWATGDSQYLPTRLEQYLRAVRS